MEKTKESLIAQILQKKSKVSNVLVIVVITAFFLSSLALIAFLSYSLATTAELEMENSTEHAFNAVLMAMRDPDNHLDDVMAVYAINGIGVYSASGNLLFSAGDVYSRLPVSNFSSMERNRVTSSLLSFDVRNANVEYFRASSQAVIPRGNSLLLPIDAINLSYPNIIYINMDATSYASEIARIRIIFATVMLSIIAIYIFILYFYSQNRMYKEMLMKQESLVSLGQAARTLTHEIKNPLSVITLQLALLKRSVKGEDLEGIYTIEHETKRLIGLTDKVSDFLKNPLGNPIKLDVVKEVKELFDLFEGEITIESGSLESAFVLFDPDRIRSVFENLIKNAFEATKEGSLPIISVSFTKNRKGLIEVAVSDRGVGIASKDLKKIFDPFYTTKINGSGIGLSISYQFVKAAGGSIAFKKRSGGGTSVVVTLREAK